MTSIIARMQWRERRRSARAMGWASPGGEPHLGISDGDDSSTHELICCSVGVSDTKLQPIDLVVHMEPERPLVESARKS